MNYEILDQILQMFDSSENSSENTNDTAESRQHFLQYLDTLDIKEIEPIVRKNTISSKGPYKINELMKAFTNGEDEGLLARLEPKRVKTCLTVVNEVISNPGIPNVNASRYLDSIELDNRFSDKSLNKLYEKCRHHLEEESRTGWRWLPFLARLLSVIQSREVFQPHPDGDQEPGVRCVEKVVRDVISIEWNHDLVTGMCSVLKVNTLNNCNNIHSFTILLSTRISS